VRILGREPRFVVDGLALDHFLARCAGERVLVVGFGRAVREDGDGAYVLRVDDFADQRFGGVERLGDEARQLREQRIPAQLGSSRRELLEFVEFGARHAL
jgi:hypothetical protein